MRLVLSNAYLAIRVVDGTLSDQAIHDLCESTQYICCRDRRRYSRLDSPTNSEVMAEE